MAVKRRADDGYDRDGRALSGRSGTWSMDIRAETGPGSRVVWAAHPVITQEVVMVLEIRTYRLSPGASAEFVRAMRDEAVPLMTSFGMDVVSYGTSLVAEDGHEEAYLVRRFPSLAARVDQEEAFYGSRAWHSGPRVAIVSRIESYHTVVVPEESLLTTNADSRT